MRRHEPCSPVLVGPLNGASLKTGADFLVRLAVSMVVSMVLSTVVTPVVSTVVSMVVSLGVDIGFGCRIPVTLDLGKNRSDGFASILSVDSDRCILAGALHVAFCISLASPDSISQNGQFGHRQNIEEHFAL